MKQARVDWTVPFSMFGDGSTFKVGAKILDRDKTNNRDFETYTAGAPGPLLTAAFKPAGVTIYDGRYVLGPRVDYNAFQALVTANPRLLTLNVAGSVGNSLVNDYEAGENVYAAYAMATLKTGQWTIIPGVRVERTEGDYKAKTITATSTVTQGFNVKGDFDYTDVFPGVNVRFDANDNLVFRGAVTTAIGRPNFADLAPYVQVDATGSGAGQPGQPEPRSAPERQPGRGRRILPAGPRRDLGRGLLQGYRRPDLHLGAPPRAGRDLRRRRRPGHHLDHAVGQRRQGPR